MTSLTSINTVCSSSKWLQKNKWLQKKSASDIESILYIVTGDCLSEIIRSLQNSSMDLLNVFVIYFNCFPKFDLSSKNIPRSFWYGVWFTRLLLKIKTACLSFLILGEKITPSACLEGSKLLLLSKPLFYSFVDVFLSQTTEKREVSSGKYLGFGDNSVDKQLI